MKTKIAGLKDHYIVCGQGRVGEQVAVELSSANVPFVVLDGDPAAFSQAKENGWNYLELDPIEDESLVAAGVERANVIITALGEDAANVFITLTARALNHDIKVIARASEASTKSKLLRAGADLVSMPYEIGGKEMANLALEGAEN